MRYVIILLIAYGIYGCTPFFQKSKVVYIDQTQNGKKVNQHSHISQKLFAQYKEWKGTQYREGGLSKRGIDCSGFVYITFRSKFGLDVPRETKQLVKIGLLVSRKDLRVGDLLFFKTGLFSRHVGIYLGNMRFLHASTTLGVTISSLKEGYWTDHYWLARRVRM